MRIAVALSGGVDSTTVARRLMADGHEVFGLTMRLCPDISALAARDGKKSSHHGLPEHGCATCAAPCACVEATQAARQLGISHEIIDLRDEFETLVIQPFVNAFAHGITPNPCAWCNQNMKFGRLLDAARARGAEALATGHYARLEWLDGLAVVRRAADQTKDQTYFMALVPRERFGGMIFPLGNDQKSSVQAEAIKDGFAKAGQETSTEICFLQDYHYLDFLRLRIPEAFVPGEVVDPAGQVLGRHEGLLHFTIGQRKGIGVAGPKPYYVIRIEPWQNQVVISTEDALWSRQAELEQVNWLLPECRDQEVSAMIRYRQKPLPARIEFQDAQHARLIFKEPVRAVTPGQIAAVYAQDRLLGGGQISVKEQVNV